MAKEKSEFSKKLDGFLRVLFLDEHGRPKSATLLYSFLLSVAFAAEYVAAYLLLLDPLEALLMSASVLIRNLVQYLVPAIAGSVLPVVLYLVLPAEQKALVPYAYLWMAALLIGMMLAMLLIADWSDGGTDYALFLSLLVLPAALSILAGGIPAWLLYRKVLQKQAENRKKAASRPSYYNT